MSKIYKEVISKDSLKTQIGMEKIASMVRRTLGPGGLPILIQRTGEALDGSPLGPRITKDGVSVAEECSAKDPEEDIIIQAVKSICKKTNEIAGDGTTTAIVLGQKILEEALNSCIKDPALNPQLVREDIEKACKVAVQSLRDKSIEVTDIKKIKEVATISANGDEEVGEIIARAYDHVGAEGVITVDEGSKNELTLETVDGYQFNKGEESRGRFFNNSKQTRFEAEYTPSDDQAGVRVIIYDGKILNFTDLGPVLKLLAGMDEETKECKRSSLPPFILLANEFSRDVIQMLIMQKEQAGVTVCPVRGPNTTHVRTSYYDDLAVYTGATRLGNGNRSLNNIQEDDLGLADKVIVNKYKTTIYGGWGAEDAILDRVEQLNAQKEVAESPYDAQIINDRIAALTNGIAKIGVGGATEMEIKEKYDRIEDALNASRAALQEGVVAGGGATLLRLSKELESKESIGFKILSKALRAPFLQILENIGLSKESDKIVKKVLEDKTKRLVFDARNTEYKDCMEAGIVDPVKVTRTALENAVSIASLLSTAGGAIVYKQD